jgi:ubiquinol oxidase
MNLHLAEELNEAYHCEIMETLGGSRSWFDRFSAYHAAIAYYWFLVVLFFLSPGQSYAFSELLEGHAVDTYGQFVEENETTLKTLPAPEVAHTYFEDFLYYFDAFQTSPGTARRPTITSLYDVFENILLDELEHVSTMSACRDHAENAVPIPFKGRDLRASSCRVPLRPLSSDQRRAYWKQWSENSAKHAASEESENT